MLLEVILLGSTDQGVMTGTGVLQESIENTSEDGVVAVFLEQGTRVLGPDGKPLGKLIVEGMESLLSPLEGYQLVTAFDFQPDIATFQPAMRVVIRYHEGDIPEGGSEEELVLALYDAGSGEYEFISGEFDTGENTVTFWVNRTNVFAVLALAEAIATPTPGPTATPVPVTEVPTPTPEPTVEPTETATPTPTPTEVPPAGWGPGPWIGIGLGAVALLGLFIWLAMWQRRRRKWNRILQEIGWLQPSESGGITAT